MIINRTKRPNRLTLNYNNILYEDDAAQSIINEHFGNSFDIISYAQQNNLNSFINLGPSEKLIFLEKFAFNGLDIDSIKNKCCDNIKKQNEKLICITSQLEMSILQLNKLSKPKKVEFPIKTKNIDNAIINEPIRLKNTKTLVKRCLNNIQLSTEKLNIAKINNIEYKNINEKNDTLISELHIKKLEVINNKYIGDTEFEKIENQLQYIDSYTKYIEQKNINESKIQELDDIIKIIWNEYSKKECENMINDYIIAKSDSEKIKELEGKLLKYTFDEDLYNKNIYELLELQKQIKLNYNLIINLEKEKENYTCPSCSTKLSLKRYDNKSILECTKYENLDEVKKQYEEILKETDVLKNKENNIQVDIKKLECNKRLIENINNNISELKNKYESLIFEDIDEDLKYIQEYYTKNMLFEKQKDIIEKNIKIFEKLPVPKIDMCKNININENIKEEYIIQKQLRKEYNKLNDDIKNIEKQIIILQSKVNSITLENEEDIILNLTNYKSELDLLRQKETLHENNLIKIDEYKKYKDDLERYKDAKEIVEKLQEEEKEQHKIYTAAMKLKEKILESESLAISNIIESINIHCQYYLDIFFPTDPIVVKLLAFKETKKNSKPQINIEVNYKDMETDLNILSGGELTRVSLAFILGLSEIFNSKIILLDECTSSLDQELTNTVIDGIRKNFSDKLVIIIAHQVVSGVFDREIKL
jgi:DNA repair exonuclease SbcCD ATPase subunit